MVGTEFVCSAAPTDDPHPTSKMADSGEKGHVLFYIGYPIDFSAQYIRAPETFAPFVDFVASAKQAVPPNQAACLTAPAEFVNLTDSERVALWDYTRAGCSRSMHGM